MFVSMNWIKDYVDLEGYDIEKLIQRFTLSTAEVEGIENKGQDVQDVVVGEIISCENHQDSEHLHLLKVNVGAEVLDIVCSAPNARVGLKTALCKVGGKVPGIKIKKSKIRGYESFGMCCSERELGISDKNEGIMELDENLEVGTNIKDIFPIDDIIFEVDNKSLTNRPDLWGHYGMAREFAALTNQKVKPLELCENDYTGSEVVPVEVKADQLTHRYTSIRIENITKKVSSKTMKIRLHYCGVRSINLLTDLTNYVMFELGQPMHAFDGRMIDKIVVKTPEQPMAFTTLDGNEREVTTDTLMIYNNDTPVAIAGVMGGLDSEIKEDTTSVVVESATFDGVCVRKSTSRLSLRTDASARYEKTLDPEMTIIAVKRFIQLLKEIDPNCTCITRITDIYNYKYPEITINFDKKFVDRYTGIDISCERIKLTLEQLGFNTTQEGENFTTVVPSWRGTKDVSMKADIIEEITRIYGYDNFEIKTTLSPLIPAKTTERRIEENLIRDILVKTYSMNEIHTRVWCDSEQLRNIGLVPEENVYILGSAEQNGILRTSLMQSFLPVVYHNRNYKSSFGIFEIGRVVEGTREDGTANEQRKLGIAMYSKDETEKSLYIEAVQLLNAMCEQLKHKLPKYTKIEVEHIWQHPKNTAKISIDGTKIGALNTIHPKTLKNITKNGSIVCIEINMDQLLSVPAAKLEFDEPSKYPSIDYDLSLILPEGIRFEQLKQCWEKIKMKELKNVSVIDIYDNGIVKCITIRMSFIRNDRTLTGEEVQKRVDLVLANFEEIGVKLKAL